MIKLLNNIEVYNMETSRGNTAPNQFIINMEGYKVFQSYNSTIAIVNWSNDSITLGGDWDYSRTTSKYLYNFLRDLGLDVYRKEDILKAIKEGKIDGRHKTWTIKEVDRW